MPSSGGSMLATSRALRVLRAPSLALVLVLLPFAATAAADRGAAAVKNDWVSAWGAPMQSTATTLPASTVGVTLREPAWLTVGGDRVRVKFSNAMNSTAALSISSASIGIRSAG